jgi:hypothetical protein
LLLLLLKPDFVNFLHLTGEEATWNRKILFKQIVTKALSFSHSLYFRACSFLTLSLFHFAESLFNFAFLSCWSELNPECQLRISQSLKCACEASLTDSIKLNFTKLFVFMEQQGYHIHVKYPFLCKSCREDNQISKLCILLIAIFMRIRMT